MPLTGPLQPRPAPRQHGVPFEDAVSVWARVAALSFGGPAGQIAVMHRIIVDEKRWIGEARFLHALSYCTLLPGPEAQQLATYIGWLMHGVRGGVVAGTLFVLPGLLSLLVLSGVYARWGQVGPVAAAFFGLKAAVLAIVVQAVVRIGSRALRNPALVVIAGTAFVALFFFHLPFPVVILGAGIIGWAGTSAGSSRFGPGGGHGSGNGLADADSLLGTGQPHPRGTRTAAVVAAVLWLTPVLALLVALGPHATLSRIGLFFSEMAVVSFGGAYAVLAYVAQQAVEHYGWLRAPEMLDGLGLAETTPGPLIIVTQFVGFLAAYRDPGLLPPMLAGALGGLLTTWVTFTPCFLWIFLGAPFIERLRENRALAGALAAITAAVVGVILNLAVWFALHTWFGQTRPVRGLDLPVLATVDVWAVTLSLGATVAIFVLRAGMIPVLLACAGAGVALYAAGAV